MTTPFPIGTYVGNPNGNDPTAEAAFETQFKNFVNLMGARPATMNAFVDVTQDPSQWAANASWTAWSWATSPVVGTSITPVIGIPMSDNNYWAGNPPGSTNDDFFKAIVAGTYDADYKGIVDAWAAQGFKTIDLRLGYEMDGSFMPWYSGSDPATQADWVAAFQHLSTLMRAEAGADHITAKIVWNPDDLAWTNAPVQNTYPGDAYVDIISTDAYSPLYPWDFYDWSLNNGTVDSSIQQWWSNPVNREHYWSYPSADEWNPTGAPGVGWGMQDTIAFAKAHNKPLAISETGAGGNGTSTGPVDDPAFPQWLAGELAQAQAEGVPIAYVNVWDADLSDGDWDFSSASATKPQEAAAWAQYFGAGGGTGPSFVLPAAQSVTVGKAVALSGGLVADTAGPSSMTLVVSAQYGTLSMSGAGVSGSGTNTITVHGTLTLINADLATLSYRAGSSAVTDTVTLDATDNARLGAEHPLAVTVTPPPATLTFKDTAGHSFTQTVISSGSLTTSPTTSGLAGNVYQWMNGNVNDISVDTFDQLVTQATISDTGGRSFQLSNLATLNASLSGASAGTFGAHAIAGGTISVGTGNYAINLTAQSASGATSAQTAALNRFNVTLGSGTDSLAIDASGTYGLTSAAVHAGSGTDQISFLGSSRASVYGGTGSATVQATAGGNIYVAGTGSLDVTGGSGAETYIFHNGDGVLKIENFSSSKHDVLQIDSSLKASMQQTSSSAGIVLSFGGPSQEIVLNGVSSTPAIHWV